MGFPIKIAVHPKAKYDPAQKVFKSRELIRGQTDRLIQTAEFVLGHTSTSLGMAFMFQKPILILHFEEFKNTTFGGWIESMAKATGQNAFYVENLESIEWKKSLHLNQKAYADYMKSFVKEPHVPDLRLSELIVRELS